MDSTPVDHDLIWRQITMPILASCGARNRVNTKDGVMFQVGQRRNLLEKVIVSYDPGLDLYMVQYVAMKRSDYSTIADESIPMVYAWQLPKIVRQMGDR